MQSYKLYDDGLFREGVLRGHLDQLPQFGKLGFVLMGRIEVDADCKVDEVEVCPTDERVPHLILAVLAFERADHHASTVHRFKLVAVSTLLKLSSCQHLSPLLVIEAEEADAEYLVLSPLLALLGEESEPIGVHPYLTPYGDLIDHKVVVLFRLECISFAYVGADNP